MTSNENLTLTQDTTTSLGHVSSAAVVFGAATLVVVAATVYALRRQTKSNNGPAPGPTFTNENITSPFAAAIPALTPQLNLEVATATQTETFTRSSNRAILWGLVDLGTNHAQVRVPVTYRYHIALRDQWELKICGNQILVTAPAIRAGLPPAIHTHEMERLSVRGWARTSPRDLMHQLEQELTPTSSEHAGSPKQLQFVRPMCRKAVAEFIQLWLVHEGKWHKDGIDSIHVRFADEAALPQEPTLRFLR